MALRNELTIGPNPLLNNLVMYRKVDNKPFTPEFTFVNDNTLDLGSNIEVRYVEYYKDTNGDIISQLTQYKTYIVPNNEGWSAANDWFISLARTPITAQVGIMDAIEATLQALPMNVPNGYHLQGPL